MQTMGEYHIPSPNLQQMSAPLPERISLSFSPSLGIRGRGFSSLVFCLVQDTTVFYATMVVL